MKKEITQLLIFSIEFVKLEKHEKFRFERLWRMRNEVMETTSYKTIELSREELYEITGGSLTEVASKIWGFFGYCFTLDTRVRIANENYNEHLAIMGY